MKQISPPYRLFPKKDRPVIIDHKDREFKYYNQTKKEICILKEIIQKSNFLIENTGARIELYQPNSKRRAEFIRFLKSEFDNCWINKSIDNRFIYPQDDLDSYPDHHALILKKNKTILGYITFDIYESEYTDSDHPITFLHFNISCSINNIQIDALLCTLLMYVLIIDIPYVSGEFDDRNDQLGNMLRIEYDFKDNDLVAPLYQMLNDSIYLNMKKFGFKTTNIPKWYNKLYRFFGFFFNVWAKQTFYRKPRQTSKRERMEWIRLRSPIKKSK